MLSETEDLEKKGLVTPKRLKRDDENELGEKTKTDEERRGRLENDIL